MASRQACLVCLLLLCPVLSLAQDLLTARVSQNLDYVDVQLCFTGKAPKSLYRQQKAADYSSGISHKGQVLEVREKEYSLELPDLPEGACIRWRTSLIDALKANDYRLIFKTGQDLSMNAALWFWKGPMERDLLVDVFLPAGLSISTPWKEVERKLDKIRFLPDKTSSDWESMIALGRFEVDSIKVPGASIKLASIGKLTNQQKTKLKSWMQESIAAVTAVSGRFPQPHPQVLVIPIGQRQEAVVKAQVLRGGGLAAIFYVDETRSLDEFSDDWTATHEFSHMLMPYISSRDRWLSEGLASYYQNVLRARDGRLTDLQAWQLLYEGFQRGKKNANGASLAQATRRGRNSTMRVYWSGAALMLMADMQLRKQSGGLQTLDTALSALSECCMENGKTWRAREMFVQLDKLTKTNTFMKLYQDHVHSNGFPDLQPVLKDLGLGIRAGRVKLTDDAPMIDVRDAIMN